jgi:putative Ca2+/H+ antiporter (TMEM165/GDT1 family)
LFLAEIGDKTFILIMISYISLGGCQTFVTAYVTLACMHLLASCLGWGIAFVIPAFWTKLCCAIIFILIGIGMIVYQFYMTDPKAIDQAVGRSGHTTGVTTTHTSTV